MMLKDPLWLFLLFGGLLFGLANWQDEERVIQVTDGDVQRVLAQWQQQMRRPPSATERQSLIDQFIQDEAYYQEALRLGLDSNDTIVRRRLIQKLTFLTEDLAASQPATEEELAAFYQENLQRYKIPELFTFRHIYFSTDRPATTPENSPRVMAQRAVLDPTLAGDPFMLATRYAGRSQREIGDLFGQMFAEQLGELTAQTGWQGPIRSAYGWHAILLEKREPSRARPLESIGEKLLADWRQAQRTAANAAYLKQLLASYEVRLPPMPDSAPITEQSSD